MRCCRGNLGAGKVLLARCPQAGPVRWDFVTQMPRTPLGKIQKFILQRELLEHEQGGT